MICIPNIYRGPQKRDIKASRQIHYEKPSLMGILEYSKSVLPLSLKALKQTLQLYLLYTPLYHPQPKTDKEPRGCDLWLKHFGVLAEKIVVLRKELVNDGENKEWFKRRLQEASSQHLGFLLAIASRKSSKIMPLLLVGRFLRYVKDNL
jgi:hypothetical protein